MAPIDQFHYHTRGEGGSQDPVIVASEVLGEGPVSVSGVRATFWCPFHDANSPLGQTGVPTFNLNIWCGSWRCSHCDAWGRDIGGLACRLKRPIPSNFTTTTSTRQPKAEKDNRRAAVEDSVRSLKHPFRQATLPVHGRFWIACILLASASMINFRRICKYYKRKEKQANENSDLEKLRNE